MNSLIKKILILTSILLALILAASVLIIYTYKDEVSKKILLSINDQTKGELKINGISIDILEHFPNISLSLIDASYYESKSYEDDFTPDQVFHFSSLHIAFNPLELLDSRLIVTAITAEKGTINILQYPDSTFNLTQAFQSNDTTIVYAQDTSDSDDSSMHTGNIALAINQLKLKDVEVCANLLTGRQKINIHSARASLKYDADSIECNLKSEIFIYQAGLNPELQLTNEQLKVEIDFFLDRKDDQINIYQSDIEFANAQFFSSGHIDLKEEGIIDLSFKVNDDESQFARLFLTSEGIDNIKQGKLFLEGKIHGKLTNSFPEIECSFGAKNLKVQIPKTGKYLENLVIDGSFSSGNRADLSTAILRIDTIYAQLPSGYIHGSALIRDLKSPKIRYSIDAFFNLQDLSRIFNLGPFENLNGMVEISDQYHGSYQGEKGWKDLSSEPFLLILKNVSFELNDVMSFSNVDGTISGNMDSLHVASLRVDTQHSDFVIDGNFLNASNFIYNKEDPIEAQLVISSELYDFPQFFSALPEVAQSFPYQISNVQLAMDAKTSFAKLTSFRKIPEIDFKLKRVAGKIENFMPFAVLQNGTFNMYEIDSTVILDFSGFDIDIANANAKADYRLITNSQTLDSMSINLKGNNMNPASIFYGFDTDSISEFINAEINGGFECDIVLPKDTSLLFETVRLRSTGFEYLGLDTISADKFDLASSEISYDKWSDSSPLATLETHGSIHITNLTSTIFQAEVLDLSINASKGGYSVSVNDQLQFGMNENGKVEVYPFESPPAYHLEYTIKQLTLHDFLASFYSEKLFTGFVDLDLNLNFHGLDIKEITSSMSGKITLEGDNLTLTGMDLDELINNFQRSQSFNLVDVGAVALAGPAGILYTKGSDYAMMLTANKGDSTSISKLSSKWNLSEGNIEIEDVAFATLENRVAAKGWLNMKTDSLDVIIGVVDESGCAIIDQQIYGKSDNPEYGKVKVIKTLLSPVTKLLNKIVAKDCRKFYDGIVTHPNQKSDK